MKPERIRKLYYSISEVSALTGVKPHVLRFWESEFPMLRPKKNRAGNRAYTAPDIAVVEQIARLLRDEKYTIEGARRTLARARQGTGSSSVAAHPDDQRAELLRLRAFLVDVLRRLEGGGSFENPSGSGAAR